MKRLITAAMSLMLVASFALAVNSENVVGYNDVVLTNGYNMLAVNFATVGAPAADIDINDFLPSGQIEVTAAGLTGKAVPTGADQVRVWNAATSVYSNYFLFKALATSNTKNYKWCHDNGSTYPVAAAKFSTGDGLWFNYVGSTNVKMTIAGQVPNNVAKTKTLFQGYNMLGSGFSAEWSLNAIGTATWSGTDFTGKAVPTGADQVRIWKTSTQSYKNYFLFKALATSNTKNYKWCLDDGGTYPVMTDMISISDAVWFIKAKAGTCAFAPQIPYTLD